MLRRRKSSHFEWNCLHFSSNEQVIPNGSQPQVIRYDTNIYADAPNQSLTLSVNGPLEWVVNLALYVIAKGGLTRALVGVIVRLYITFRIHFELPKILCFSSGLWTCLDWCSQYNPVRFQLNSHIKAKYYASNFKLKQEYIPVGCVPAAAVAVCLVGFCPGGCLPRRGVSALGDVCPGGVCQTSSCERNDWQTGVKTLPCGQKRG